MKQLYIVEIRYEAYVVAESEVEACAFSGEINHWETPEVEARLADNNILPGWAETCLVYGKGPDRTLGNALKLIPAAP